MDRPVSRTGASYAFLVALIGGLFSQPAHQFIDLSPTGIHALFVQAQKIAAHPPALLHTSTIVLALIVLAIGVAFRGRLHLGWIQRLKRHRSLSAVHVTVVVAVIQVHLFVIEELLDLELGEAGDAMADGSPWSFVVWSLMAPLPVAAVLASTIFRFSRLATLPIAVALPKQPASYAPDTSSSGRTQRYPRAIRKRGPPAAATC